MAEVLVAMQNASRAYRSGPALVQALIAASCEVRGRDRIAVIGPSGSGKSTLLHLMGGVDEPTSGRVTWPVLGAQEQLRPNQIGFVFQTPSLLPALTVQENVELTWLMTQREERGAKPAAREIIERLGLESIADKLPEELSGGQAQRAVVARALVCRPRLVLADEPTGQLDRTTAHDLFDALLALVDSSESALVVATHDLAVADRMQSRWHLSHGQLEVAT